jgi:hypothetical protein
MKIEHPNLTVEQALYTAVDRIFTYDVVPREPNYSCIFSLDDSEYDLLMSQGWIHEKNYDQEDLNWSLYKKGICIIYKMNAHDLYSENLDTLFSHMHFGYYSDSPDYILNLISKETFIDILPKHMNNFKNRIPNIGNMQDVMNKPALKDKTIAYISNRKDISEMVYVCDYERDGIECGMPECHCEHAWIKDGVCLAYLSGGSDIYNIYLYPFVKGWKE